MSGTAAAILASVSAVVQLFVVAGVGTMAARYPREAPLFPRSALQSVSKVMSLYNIPCLIVHTVGSAVSVELLQVSQSAVVALPW